VTLPKNLAMTLGVVLPIKIFGGWPGPHPCQKKWQLAHLKKIWQLAHLKKNLVIGTGRMDRKKMADVIGWTYKCMKK
jgi:hypothetical protein